VVSKEDELRYKKGLSFQIKQNKTFQEFSESFYKVVHIPGLELRKGQMI
jgi:hypothetical protein